jgi:Uma2 family endonuclease
LDPDDRVELIGPEIIIKALKSTLHSVCNSLLVEELIILLARRARMGVQEPIILTDDSEPEKLLLPAIEPMVV